MTRGDIRRAAEILVERGMVHCALGGGWDDEQTLRAVVRQFAGRLPVPGDFGDVPRRLLGAEPSPAEWKVLVEMMQAYAREQLAAVSAHHN